MIKKIYSIYDSAAQAYMNPFTVGTDEQALRAFKEVISDEQSNPHKYPDDFQLYNIGLMDDHNGLLDPVHPPKRLVTAKEIKNEMQRPMEDYIIPTDVKTGK